MHRIYTPLFLRSSRRHKCDKRMLLMTGFTSGRLSALFAVMERALLNMAFSRPSAMKRNHFKVFIVHIQTRTVDFLDAHFLAAIIDYSGASGQDIFFFKNRVRKNQLQSKHLIATVDIECFYLIFCSERSRKSAQFMFAFVDFMRMIKEFTSHASVTVTDVDTAFSVTAYTA